MAVIIDLKDKPILDCSSSVFLNLHFEMLNIVDKEDLTLSDNVMNLIMHLEAGYGGIGLDIADYISSKKDFLTFLHIASRAIHAYYLKYDSSQFTQDALENFYLELMRAQEYFSK